MIISSTMFYLLCITSIVTIMIDLSVLLHLQERVQVIMINLMVNRMERILEIVVQKRLYVHDVGNNEAQ